MAVHIDRKNASWPLLCFISFQLLHWTFVLRKVILVTLRLWCKAPWLHSACRRMHLACCSIFLCETHEPLSLSFHLWHWSTGHLCTRLNVHFAMLPFFAMNVSELRPRLYSVGKYNDFVWFGCNQLWRWQAVHAYGLIVICDFKFLRPHWKAIRMVSQVEALGASAYAQCCVDQLRVWTWSRDQSYINALQDLCRPANILRPQNMHRPTARGQKKGTGKNAKC